MKIHLKKGGEIKNTINATLEFAQEHYTQLEGWEIEVAPEAPAPTHKATFSPSELYNSFTADEAISSLAHSNPAVVAQAQLLSVGRDVSINVDDAGYQSAINLLETEGILTEERAADFRQGLPID